MLSSYDSNFDFISKSFISLISFFTDAISSLMSESCSDRVNILNIPFFKETPISLNPSYSVKPKSIDFTGFDDFYFTSNKSRE